MGKPAKKPDSKKPGSKKPVSKKAESKKPAKSKSLVIVESPTKARTLTKYLGRGYQVMASVGHIKDLPKSKLGVDLDHNFQPQYVVIRGKSKILNEIKSQAKKSSEYLFGSRS